MYFNSYNNRCHHKSFNYRKRVFCCGFSTAFALKCWQCDGEVNPNCNDPFDGTKLGERTSLLDCIAPKDETANCIKSKGTVQYYPYQCDGIISKLYFFNNFLFFLFFSISFNDEAGDIVTRQCAITAKETNATCYSFKFTEDPAKQAMANVELFCEPCEGDGCNGASQFSPAVVMFTISVIIMIIATS